MKFVNVQQGTDEWLELKRHHRSASEASSLMGQSKHASRRALLRAVATGEKAAIKEYTQKVFDHGHAVEEAARPIQEARMGEDLYPAVALDDEGNRMASFDGITMDNATSWECKQWTKDKAKLVADGRIPSEDYWQLVHQLMVGAGEIKRVVYTVTDGTADNMVSTELHHESAQIDIEQLRMAWEQFDRDAANFHDSQPTLDDPEAQFEADLPAIIAHTDTDVSVKSNVDEVAEQMRAILQRIHTNPETDQQAADANEATKWCKKAEEAISKAEQELQDRTASITDALKAMADLRQQVRQTRLDAEKGVKALKEHRKQELVDNAVADYQAWLGQFDLALFERAGITLPVDQPRFHQAMKNKKTLKSCQEAVDQALADLKVETATFMGRAQRNLSRLFEHHGEQLFPDLVEYIDTDPEAFAAILDRRREQAKKQAENSEASTAHNDGDLKRPSDSEIIHTLAWAYGVEDSTARQWLREMDLTQKEAAA